MAIADKIMLWGCFAPRWAGFSFPCVVRQCGLRCPSVISLHLAVVTQVFWDNRVLQQFEVGLLLGLSRKHKVSCMHLRGCLCLCHSCFQPLLQLLVQVFTDILMCMSQYQTKFHPLNDQLTPSPGTQIRYRS